MSIDEKIVSLHHVSENSESLKCIFTFSTSAAATTYGGETVDYAEKRDHWEKYCFQPGLQDFQNWKKEQKEQKVEVKKWIKKASAYRVGGDGAKYLKVLLAYVKNVVENSDNKYHTIQMNNKQQGFQDYVELLFIII